jgi:hypothetical protein
MDGRDNASDGKKGGDVFEDDHGNLRNLNPRNDPNMNRFEG